MTKCLNSLGLLVLGGSLVLPAPAVLASSGVKIFVGSSSISSGYGVRTGGDRYRSGYRYSRPYTVIGYGSSGYNLRYRGPRYQHYYAKPYIGRHDYSKPYSAMVDRSRPIPGAEVSGFWVTTSSTRISRFDGS